MIRTRPRLNFALKVGLIVFALIALGEIIARFTADTAVQYMLLDKKLHCLEADGFTIGLCPGVSLHLRHPRGFDYRISTSARGERRASDLLSYLPPGKKPVWILGDSIAMGFGVHDRETFPYLLAREKGRAVANLGVDGLGARAVLHRFRRALRERKRPGLVLRIVHPSDFADDERDERYARSFLRAALFRGHFQLARWSALYNWIRRLTKYRHAGPARGNANRPRARKAYRPGPRIIPKPGDLKHPTFRCTELLIREAQQAGIALVFVIYPAWDGATGLPRNDYGDLRGLPNFIESRGARLKDLAAAFHGAPDPGVLYIPGDGHPSAAAARVFLRELAPFVID